MLNEEHSEGECELGEDAKKSNSDLFLSLSPSLFSLILSHISLSLSPFFSLCLPWLAALATTPVEYGGLAGSFFQDWL